MGSADWAKLLTGAVLFVVLVLLTYFPPGGDMARAADLILWIKGALAALAAYHLKTSKGDSDA
ncbi:MAG: hypothetical protein V4463_05150 [Pseudomonadota bacterium]